MKFDLHCHTKNGSPDAKIDIEDYVRILRSKGFDGMLLTDHTSYNGYRAWKEVCARKPEYERFLVLCGIEYDTRDAGHILVIMPQDMELSLLEVRGMRLEVLANTVHSLGGILGPAHPYGGKSWSLRQMKRLTTEEAQIMQHFDFVEVFNTCETIISNQQARSLAKRNNMVCTAGSDSHKELYVGTAYTEIDYPIRNNDDLIWAIQHNLVTACGGVERKPVSKYRKLIPLSTAFLLYNQCRVAAEAYTRHYLLKLLSQRHTEFLGKPKKEA